MTREEDRELLAALTAERQTSLWWATPAPGERRKVPAPEWDDSEITTARRRRELLAATETKESGVA